MAKWELDIATDPDVDSFEQTHELDGRSYVLRFDWNTRDEAWRMTVKMPDGTVVAAGRKVVVGAPLLRGLVDSRLPPGVLVAVDLNETDRDPAHDDLGVRVSLVYYDADELASIKDGA